ncbi:hypothetical protein BOX15_Mlig011329g1, partial [Macrostomum lignano]
QQYQLKPGAAILCASLAVGETLIYSGFFVNLPSWQAILQREGFFGCNATVSDAVVAAVQTVEAEAACPAEGEARFALVHSIGVGVHMVACFVAGLLLDRLGRLPCRLAGAAAALACCLCFGLAAPSPAGNAALYAGAILWGVSSAVSMVTCLSIGGLMRRGSSLLVCSVSGAFDSSALVPTLVLNLCLAAGGPAQSSRYRAAAFVSLGAAVAIISLCLTGLLARLDPRPPRTAAGGCNSTAASAGFSSEPTLAMTLCSRLYISHLAWAMASLLVFLLCLSHAPLLAQLAANGVPGEAYRQLSLLGALMFAGLPAAFAVALGLRAARRLGPRPAPRSLAWPLLAQCGTGCAVCCLGLASPPLPLVPQFALLVAYRSLLFALLPCLLLDAFPAGQFGRLYGLVSLSGAGFAWLQYPLLRLSLRLDDHRPAYAVGAALAGLAALHPCQLLACPAGPAAAAPADEDAGENDSRDAINDDNGGGGVGQRS